MCDTMKYILRKEKSTKKNLQLCVILRTSLSKEKLTVMCRVQNGKLANE